VSLSVTKWGQSSGDGADKQEEIKRQKRYAALLRLPFLFALTLVSESLCALHAKLLARHLPRLLLLLLLLLPRLQQPLLKPLRIIL
jgi:hypothetical protein